jgi:hypothetical protein
LLAAAKIAMGKVKALNKSTIKKFIAYKIMYLTSSLAAYSLTTFSSYSFY